MKLSIECLDTTEEKHIDLRRERYTKENSQGVTSHVKFALKFQYVEMR
jgi:hypothetical protein